MVLVYERLIPNDTGNTFFQMAMQRIRNGERVPSTPVLPGETDLEAAQRLCNVLYCQRVGRQGKILSRLRPLEIDPAVPHPPPDHPTFVTETFGNQPQKVTGGRWAPLTSVLEAHHGTLAPYYNTRFVLPNFDHIAEHVRRHHGVEPRGGGGEALGSSLTTGAGRVADARRSQRPREQAAGPPSQARPTRSPPSRSILKRPAPAAAIEEVLAAAVSPEPPEGRGRENAVTEEITRGVSWAAGDVTNEPIEWIGRAPPPGSLTAAEVELRILTQAAAQAPDGPEISPVGPTSAPDGVPPSPSPTHEERDLTVPPEVASARRSLTVVASTIAPPANYGTSLEELKGDPAVADLMWVNVKVGTQRTKMVSVRALVDSGARLSMASKKLTAEHWPGALEPLINQRTGSGVQAGSAFPITHCIPLLMTLGSKAVGSVVTVTQARKFFVLESDIPLLLGKDWIQEQQQNGAHFDWVNNQILFKHPDHTQPTPVIMFGGDLKRARQSIPAMISVVFGDNWKLLDGRFEELSHREAKDGRGHFTIELCNEWERPGVANNHISNFCALPGRDGRLEPLEDENAFMNPPFREIMQWILSVLFRQIIAQRKGSVARALVVAPVWKWLPFWRVLTFYYDQIDLIPTEAATFTTIPKAPGQPRHYAGGTPWPVALFRTRDSLCTLTPELLELFGKHLPKDIMGELLRRHDQALAQAPPPRDTLHAVAIGFARIGARMSEEVRFMEDSADWALDSLLDNLPPSDDDDHGERESAESEESEPPLPEGTY